MEEINARIQKTMLGFEDHGIFTCMVTLEFKSTTVQGFGGYSMNGASNFGGQFIQEILRAVGVEEWEKLPGKHVRVRRDNSSIVAIGNIIEDRWFEPREFAKAYGGS